MSESLGEPGPAYRVARRGMDPATKRLVIIAASLGAALLLILGASRLKGHGERAIPVIEADSRPLRVKPDNPGGMQVAGANDEIMSGDAGPEADKLLPPPEAPMPEALKPPTAEPPAAEPAPAPRAAVSIAPSPVQSAPATSPPPATVPEHKSAAPAKAAAATPPTGNPASTEVQLAAMDSEQLARAEWQRLSRLMPDVLGGRQPAVLKVEREGRLVWRLRTGGFATASQATAFCERVKAKGAGCSIANF